jgi:hypothetical protein
MKAKGITYVVDVTELQATDSEEGYPRETSHENEAFALFKAAVAEFGDSELGSYTVKLLTKTNAGETVQATQLV